MIIACPACATRYVVPDSAIGIEGRTVRCAKCRHSWFQDGPELAEPIAAAYAEPAAAGVQPSPPRPAQTPAQTPAPAPAPVDPAPRVAADMDAVSAAAQPQPGPFAADPAPEPEQPVAHPSPAAGTAAHGHDGHAMAANTGAAASGGDAPGYAAVSPSAGDEPADPFVDAEPPPPVDWQGRGFVETPADTDDVSQFEHAVPFRPRRNWLRWLTWGAGAFAALALAAMLAVRTFGLPAWLPIEQPLFGSDPGLKVEFPASEQERRTLPNGAEFFGARVVVKNETRETKRVPPLLIVLRDARERVVYSWELVPPQRTLAPGEAQTINEAMTDVPKSAVYADIGWAPR